MQPTTIIRIQWFSAALAIPLAVSCLSTEDSQRISGSSAGRAQALTNVFAKMDASTDPVLIYTFLLADGGAADSLADDISTARALQGLVNRSGARVYIIGSPHEAAWIQQIGRETIDGGTTLEEMFSRHRSFMVGPYFLYDVTSQIDEDWAFPLALTQAGLESGLPVTQAIYDRLSTIQDSGVESFLTSRFESRVDAYKWALEHQLPDAGTSVVFLLRQGTWRLYDYATATRGFVFHLDWKNSEEKDLATKILSDPHFQGPTPTLLLGYYYDSSNTGKGDTFSPMAAHNGLFGIAADYFGNASFWSSYPRAASAAPRRGYSIAPRPGVLYTSLFVSDGDNFQYNQNFLRTWIGSAAAADLNAGVSLNPGLVDFAPPLIDWARTNASPGQELIGGANGLAYSYPVLSDDSPESGTFRRWLSHNAAYMAEAGLGSAQLWKHEDFLWADGGESQDFLRHQPGIVGLLNGDVNPDAGYLTRRPAHVYGTQVAVNALGVTVNPDAGREFRTNLGAALALQLPDGGPEGGFCATQVTQLQPDPLRAGIPVAVDFANDVVALNQQYGGRLVPLAPRDWFASIRDNYFRADQSQADAGILLFSFVTASPGERPFLHQDNSAIGPGGERYADLGWSWTYEIDVPDMAQNLVVNLNLAGAHKITLTGAPLDGGVDGGFWFDESTNVWSRRWLSLPVPFATTKLKVKFEDPTPDSGYGPSLTQFELRANPEAEVVSVQTDFYWYYLSSPRRPYFVKSASSGYAFDNDHIYADMDGYFTFGLPIVRSRLNFAEIQIRGQFVIEGALDVAGPYTVLAAAHFGATPETIRVNLDPLASADGAFSTDEVFLRFRDARITDGNGPSVWRVRILADDFRYAAFFDSRVYSPYAVGTSAPEEQALLYPAGNCNVSSTNGDISDSGVLIGGDAHRYADTSFAFTYRLYFDGLREFGYATIDVGGDYVISATAPTDGGCPPESSWVRLEQLDGGQGEWSLRHRTSVDLSQFISPSNREVYLRFTDRTPDGGAGASLSSLRAFSR